MTLLAVRYSSDQTVDMFWVPLALAFLSLLIAWKIEKVIPFFLYLKRFQDKSSVKAATGFFRLLIIANIVLMLFYAFDHRPR